MKKISEFICQSENAAIDRKRKYLNMPIEKCGGIWIGDRRDLDEWRRYYTRGQVQLYGREKENGASERKAASGKDKSGAKGK